jgi:hypothetical protein
LESRWRAVGGPLEGRWRAVGGPLERAVRVAVRAVCWCVRASSAGQMTAANIGWPLLRMIGACVLQGGGERGSTRLGDIFQLVVEWVYLLRMISKHLSATCKRAFRKPLERAVREPSGSRQRAVREPSESRQRAVREPPESRQRAAREPLEMISKHLSATAPRTSLVPRDSSSPSVWGRTRRGNGCKKSR